MYVLFVSTPAVLIEAKMVSCKTTIASMRLVTSAVLFTISIDALSSFDNFFLALSKTSSTSLALLSSGHHQKASQ